MKSVTTPLLVERLRAAVLVKVLGFHDNQVGLSIWIVLSEGQQKFVRVTGCCGVPTLGVRLVAVNGVDLELRKFMSEYLLLKLQPFQS